MARNKSLIEKIWWMIPPVFFIFVYMPLRPCFTLTHLASFSVWSGVSWITDPDPMGMFAFGFMGIEYSITRRKSLLLRIIVPIISSIIGYHMGFLLLLAIYGA